MSTTTNLKTPSPIISCSELSLKTPFTCVEDVSVTVRTGDWVEVVGPARSGKSLIFQVLSLRTIVPNANIVFKNRNIDRIAKYEIAKLRRSIASCAQRPLFLEDRTVIENLVLPSVARKEIASAKSSANSILEEFELEPIKDIKLKHLSYQDRILVAVARTFIDDPELIIIDSVFETVSIPYQDRILEGLIRRHELNTAILLFAVARTAIHSDAIIVQLHPPLIDDLDSI